MSRTTLTAWGLFLAGVALVVVYYVSTLGAEPAVVNEAPGMSGGPQIEITVAGEGEGFYLSPAVVADVDNSMRIAREEIFGPVASVIPFDGEDEAIAIANDSDYGLSGSIWTGSATRAIRVARSIRTGTLSVNSNKSVRFEAPFGGYKRSGLGRELGMGALDAYTEVKNVFFSEED